MRRVEEDSSGGGRPLHLLPSIVLLQICDSLGTEDVLALSRTNKFLNSLLNSCFLLFLQLPVAEGHEALSRNKHVLRLTSTCNVYSLPNIENFSPFNSLNLSKLKELSLTGNNHVWNTQYLLSDQYKRVLKFLMSSLSRLSIKRLEFLTDESRESVEMMNGFESFNNLQEVVVHGIGYFNACASYHMDKEIAQQIINKVLSNTSLKVLRLKSFQTINRCVVFESPSLESLEAELGKSYEVGLLTLPRVRNISIDCSMWYGCFYHAQNGQLKKIVNFGCPSLESFNGIDLAALAQRSTEGHWMDELREYSLGQMGATEGQCVLCSEQ